MNAPNRGSFFSRRRQDDFKYVTLLAYMFPILTYIAVDTSTSYPSLLLPAILLFSILYGNATIPWIVIPRSVAYVLMESIVWTAVGGLTPLMSANHSVQYILLTFLLGIVMGYFTPIHGARSGLLVLAYVLNIYFLVAFRRWLRLSSVTKLAVHTKLVIDMLYSFTRAYAVTTLMFHDSRHATQARWALGQKIEALKLCVARVGKSWYCSGYPGTVSYVQMVVHFTSRLAFFFLISLVNQPSLLSMGGLASLVYFPLGFFTGHASEDFALLGNGLSWKPISPQVLSFYSLSVCLLYLLPTAELFYTSHIIFSVVALACLFPVGKPRSIGARVCICTDERAMLEYPVPNAVSGHPNIASIPTTQGPYASTPSAPGLRVSANMLYSDRLPPMCREGDTYIGYMWTVLCSPLRFLFLLSYMFLDAKFSDYAGLLTVPRKGVLPAPLLTFQLFNKALSAHLVSCTLLRVAHEFMYLYHLDLPFVELLPVKIPHVPSPTDKLKEVSPSSSGLNSSPSSSTAMMDSSFCSFSSSPMDPHVSGTVPPPQVPSPQGVSPSVAGQPNNKHSTSHTALARHTQHHPVPCHRTPPCTIAQGLSLPGTTPGAAHLENSIDSTQDLNASKPIPSISTSKSDTGTRNRKKGSNRQGPTSVNQEKKMDRKTTGIMPHRKEATTSAVCSADQAEGSYMVSPSSNEKVDTSLKKENQKESRSRSCSPNREHPCSEEDRKRDAHRAARNTQGIPDPTLLPAEPTALKNDSPSLHRSDSSMVNVDTVPSPFHRVEDISISINAESCEKQSEAHRYGSDTAEDPVPMKRADSPLSSPIAVYTSPAESFDLHHHNVGMKKEPETQSRVELSTDDRTAVILQDRIENDINNKAPMNFPSSQRALQMSNNSATIDTDRPVSDTEDCTQTEVHSQPNDISPQPSSRHVSRRELRRERKKNKSKNDTREAKQETGLSEISDWPNNVAAATDELENSCVQLGVTSSTTALETTGTNQEMPQQNTNPEEHKKKTKKKKKTNNTNNNSNNNNNNNQSEFDTAAVIGKTPCCSERVATTDVFPIHDAVRPGLQRERNEGGPDMNTQRVVSAPRVPTADPPRAEDPATGNHPSATMSNREKKRERRRKAPNAPVPNHGAPPSASEGLPAPRRGPTAILQRNQRCGTEEEAEVPNAEVLPLGQTLRSELETNRSGIVETGTREMQQEHKRDAILVKQSTFTQEDQVDCSAVIVCKYDHSLTVEKSRNRKGRGAAKVGNPPVERKSKQQDKNGTDIPITQLPTEPRNNASSTSQKKSTRTELNDSSGFTIDLPSQCRTHPEALSRGLQESYEKVSRGGFMGPYVCRENSLITSVIPNNVHQQKSGFVRDTSVEMPAPVMKPTEMCQKESKVVGSHVKSDENQSSMSSLIFQWGCELDPQAARNSHSGNSSGSSSSPTTSSRALNEFEYVRITSPSTVQGEVASSPSTSTIPAGKPTISTLQNMFKLFENAATTPLREEIDAMETLNSDSSKTSVALTTQGKGNPLIKGLSKVHSDLNPNAPIFCVQSSVAKPVGTRDNQVATRKLEEASQEQNLLNQDAMLESDLARDEDDLLRETWHMSSEVRSELVSGCAGSKPSFGRDFQYTSAREVPQSYTQQNMLSRNITVGSSPSMAYPSGCTNVTGSSIPQAFWCGSPNPMFVTTGNTSGLMGSGMGPSTNLPVTTSSTNSTIGVVPPGSWTGGIVASQNTPTTTLAYTLGPSSSHPSTITPHMGGYTGMTAGGAISSGVQQYVVLTATTTPNGTVYIPTHYLQGSPSISATTSSRVPSYAAAPNVSTLNPDTPIASSNHHVSMGFPSTPLAASSPTQTFSPSGAMYNAGNSNNSSTSINPNNKVMHNAGSVGVSVVASSHSQPIAVNPQVNHTLVQNIADGCYYYVVPGVAQNVVNSPSCVETPQTVFCGATPNTSQQTTLNTPTSITGSGHYNYTMISPSYNISPHMGHSVPAAPVSMKSVHSAHSMSSAGFTGSVSEESSQAATPKHGLISNTFPNHTES